MPLPFSRKAKINNGSPTVEGDTPSSGSYAISPEDSHSKPAEQQDRPRARRASEAATSCNGLDHIDGTGAEENRNHRSNGNIVDVHVVSESNHSIDVLSGGESDAGDTLCRSTLNNNSNFYTGSISSYGLGTLRARHLVPDILYYVTKELLLTERTYKSDLEVITVWWSGLVSEVVRAGGVRSEGVEALGRPCVALEPVALAQAACVARLERACRVRHRDNAEEEPEYHQVAELFYDYLKNSYDAYWCYVSRAGAMVARLESVRRGGGAAAAHVCAEIETRAPLSLAHHLLRALHRLLQYRRIAQQLDAACECSELTQQTSALATRLADAAESQLAHAENHALLCQLQRDITGFDKLLVPEREFVRLGSLYKHSSKGLQQRMLFLFSDVAVWCSKPGGAHAQQFRAHTVSPLCRLAVCASADAPNAFVLTDESSTMTVSCAGGAERDDWVSELERCCAAARLRPAPEQHPLAHGAPAPAPAPAPAHTGLAHVCWHRGTTLTRAQYHLAMKTHLSGYLLRKFKNSHGWQKLWVVLATATLLFYKGWHEQRPLASLPLLGYTVSTPSAADDIHKEFVFKLLFKNHVYFFRAESEYTFNRWIEELRTAIGQPSQS